MKFLSILPIALIIANGQTSLCMHYLHNAKHMAQKKVSVKVAAASTAVVCTGVTGITATVLNHVHGKQLGEAQRSQKFYRRMFYEADEERNKLSYKIYKRHISDR